MAFGLGFNKTKVLSNAEKHVQQGKLQNAIAEYEKILKHDPKDLTVLNTVGDLYARLGQTDEACNCFKTVGDAYAQQGFTVKAIAMYKKLTKLKSTLESVLKLAELYTQQGLFNDARQQYLQVADEFLRAGELDQAVRIFQKTLEMDPENVAMKVRLAEVYIRLKKKDEAWQIFSGAAEQLRARGQLAPAEDILQRMLTLDPKNSHALLLRGRNSLEAGDYASAIHYLQQVPDLDSKVDGVKALLQAYLATDKLSDAGVLATKLLTAHNEIGGISSFVAALMKGSLFQDALNVYHQYADRLLADDQKARSLENLHAIIGHVRDEPEALEMVMELLQKAGDTTHNNEITELLAHASVKKGDLERARELYQHLTTVEPQNPIHAQNLQQVSARMGELPRADAITPEEGIVILDELEATAPTLDQNYPEAVVAQVRAALTDCDLFMSYNMPAKALGPLMEALPKAPEELRLNQRLAALHTRASRFAEAAACCRTLEKIYSQAGYAEEAGRYGELAARYESRAGIVTGGEVPQERAEEFAATSGEAAPWPASSHGDFTIEPAVEAHAASEPQGVADVPEVAEAVPASGAEFDLSSEWESEPAEPAAAEAVAEESASAPETEIAPAASVDLVNETVEEIRFYLQHRMRLQALAALAKLDALTKDQDLLVTLRAEYEGAFTPAPAAKAEPVQEAPAEEISIEEEAAAENLATATEQADIAADLDQLVVDLEANLGDGFDVTPPPVQPERAAPVEVASAPRHEDTLGEFVADLEAVLPEDFLPAAPPGPVKSQPPAKAQPAAATSPAAARAGTAVAAASAPAAPVTVAPVPVAAVRAAVPAPAETAPTAAAPARAPHAGTDLARMFDDLRGELEEDTATTAADQDPETHYNLGVAFREMGLLDEAIGELQKVCQIVERGHSFPHLMQTYTWLAQCFLDKNVPEAAIRWYEQALKLPNLDRDTRTALHYELASAHEAAQNRDAALKNFMEVYGTNIDYRDVAERIKALKS
jgi:pilus assembly protein FimV